MKTKHKSGRKHSADSLTGAATRAAEGLPLDPVDLVAMMQQNMVGWGEKCFELFTNEASDWTNTFTDMVAAIEKGQPHPTSDRMEALFQVVRVMAWLVSSDAPASIGDVIRPVMEYPELRDAELVGWIDGLTRSLLTRRWQLGLPDVPETPTPSGINMHYADPATRAARAQQDVDSHRGGGRR